MQETNCECLIHHESPQLSVVIQEAASLMSFQKMALLSRHNYETPEPPGLPFDRQVNMDEKRRRPAIIVHSSGSTGLPKPIEVGHARYTIAYAVGSGDSDFMTLPLYVPFPSKTRPILTKIAKIP